MNKHASALQTSGNDFQRLETLISIYPSLWILNGAYVGQVSRLTLSDLRSRASRPRHIPESRKQPDFGISPAYCCFSSSLPGKLPWQAKGLNTAESKLCQYVS
jgi:hypothetical protein